MVIELEYGTLSIVIKATQVRLKQTYQSSGDPVEPGYHNSQGKGERRAGKHGLLCCI
jgi:hypothetical protein